VRCLLTSLFILLLTYAGALRALECSDYYGLNICADSLELTDEQASYLEPSENRYSVKAQEKRPLPKTGLSAEDMNQLQEDSVFRNIDDFRAYMSTLEPSDRTSDDDFSFRTRILDSTNFDLDCRLVTDNLYDISKSNRYDCALQRDF
jgi:hypothetical protein